MFVVRSMSDIDFERPLKKRRFFLEEPKDVSHTASGSLSVPQAEPTANGTTNNGDDSTKDEQAGASNKSGCLDQATLESFVGEKLSAEIMQRLQDLSSGNIEQGGLKLHRA